MYALFFSLLFNVQQECQTRKLVTKTDSIHHAHLSIFPVFLPSKDYDHHLFYRRSLSQFLSAQIFFIFTLCYFGIKIIFYFIFFVCFCYTNTFISFVLIRKCLTYINTASSGDLPVYLIRNLAEGYSTEL